MDEILGLKLQVNDNDDDDKNKVEFLNVQTVFFFSMKFIVPESLARSCNCVLQNTGKLWV